MPVSSKGPGLDGMMKAVRDLTRHEVLVGIPEDGAARTPEKGEASAPSNALIGYVMENGSPEQNIPARPFLGPGIESVQDRITDRFRKIGEAALAGNASVVENETHAAGLIAQAAVRAKITDGPFAPLTPRTLQARRARGRTGDTPLVDTGQLRNAVKYVVREKGK